jgi:8-oxo-dGTP pyrophosphatase MutT (NUDIX family)
MHPGYWGLFGGRRDRAEKPKMTAIREVREELGIELRDANVKSLCDVKIQRGDARGAFGVRYFSAELNVDMDCLTLRRNTHEGNVEGEGLGWFTAEEVDHLMVRPEDRTAIRTFFRKHGT